MDNFPPGMQGLIINSKVYEAVPLSTTSNTTKKSQNN